MSLLHPALIQHSAQGNAVRPSSHTMAWTMLLCATSVSKHSEGITLRVCGLCGMRGSIDHACLP